MTFEFLALVAASQWLACILPNIDHLLHILRWSACITGGIIPSLSSLGPRVANNSVLPFKILHTSAYFPPKL